MKTRQGFVSNSSTSSFVILGVLLDAHEHTREEIADKLYPGEDKGEYPEDWIYGACHRKIWIQTDGEGGAPKGKLLVGPLLARSSSYEDLRPTQSTLPELEAQIAELREKLDLSEKDHPTVVVTGSYCC